MPDHLDPVDMPRAPLSALLTERPELAGVAIAARLELTTAAA